jgi:enediyne biosynthesis protein E4
MKRFLPLLILILSSHWTLGQNFRKVLSGPLVTLNKDSRAVAWVDYDGDGWQDIFITNGPSFGQNNLLFHNDGNGQFSLVSSSPVVSDGDPSDGTSWADYNNDGYPDCFTANWYGQNNLLYENQGPLGFNQLNTGPISTNNGYSETGSWGDYDKDGFVDLYVTNSGGLKENFLYHNNGNGSFNRILTGLPSSDQGTSRSVNWVDYDLDGDLDLFVSNETNEANDLYRNDSPGFTKLNISGLNTDLGNTQSSSWADYDNDGDLDVFVSNFDQNNRLYRNDGPDTFTAVLNDTVSLDGGRSFGTNWADIDNDGDQDLFVANAYSTGAQLKNFLYLNRGDGSFIRADTGVVSTELGWTFGAAFGDYDKDGDLDLMCANNFASTEKNTLFENLSNEEINANHWAVFRLKAVLSNASAIGAKVRLKAQINGQTLWQIREISAQSGYCGQNMMPVHFGLGDATIMDTVSIQWPNGNTEILSNLQIDSNYIILEGQGTVLSLFGENERTRSEIRLYPNPASTYFSLQFFMEKEGKIDLELYDSMGKNIANLESKEFNKGEVEWKNIRLEKLENLKPGHYHVRISTAGKSWVRKLMIQSNK